MPIDIDDLRRRHGMEDYLTTGELAKRIGKDQSRIIRADQAGSIPAPIRIGTLKIRLYSPAQVEQVERHFKRTKTGRPKGKR